MNLPKGWAIAQWHDIVTIAHEKIKARLKILMESILFSEEAVKLDELLNISVKQAVQLSVEKEQKTAHF